MFSKGIHFFCFLARADFRSGRINGKTEASKADSGKFLSSCKPALSSSPFFTSTPNARHRFFSSPSKAIWLSGRLKLARIRGSLGGAFRAAGSAVGLVADIPGLVAVLDAGTGARRCGAGAAVFFAVVTAAGAAAGVRFAGAILFFRLI